MLLPGAGQQRFCLAKPFGWVALAALPVLDSMEPHPWFCAGRSCVEADQVRQRLSLMRPISKDLADRP